jgi:hypothetical protein
MQNSALLKNAKHNLNKTVICLYPITSAVEGEKALVNVPQMNGIYLVGKRKIWGLVSVVVKALRYKSEGLGIDSRYRRGFFRGI